MNALSASPLPFASRMASLRPSAIREILKTTESPDVISFAGGLPAAEFFPCEEIRAAADAVLQSDGPGALQYGITEGYGPLREWAAGHLRETVGLEVPPSQILITHGSQQGLDLLGKVLIDPGDTVIVESPAYLGALQAFQAYQANVVGIPADEEGLRADLLAETLAQVGPRPKFLYLIPNFQNPTGTSMSVRRRREIARLAREHDLLVVEDDPYGRLRYSGEESPALGALPDAGDWAYLGTASKILAPGLRVAWLATSHRGLYEKLVTGKQSCDLHTSTLNQRIVWQAVSQTAWLDSHIRRIRQAYGARRDAMLRTLEMHLPKGAHWTHPDGGLFLWVTLPGAVDTIELLRQAGSCKVAFVPGAPFWVGNVPKNTLRLNFSHAAEPLIEEGIARLGLLVARS
ncbi:aminotransferase [Opitutaceae bacterium EW11]|nr:aminotransferase [Opitutaceae bacterium EW11]